jgi:predicted transcriptional regulator
LRPPNTFRKHNASPLTDRQAELLRAIAKATLPLSIADSGKLCGMNRNQAERSLCALELRGLVSLMGHGGPRCVTDAGLRVATEGRAA